MAKIREDKIYRTTGEKIVFALVFVLFSVYALSVVLAIVWAFYNSLKDISDFWNNNKLALPKKWLFSNYAKAAGAITDENTGTTFFGMYINSFWYAGGMALLSTFIHCVTGYIFAKYKFKGKELAFSFILFTIALPIVGNLPSMYKVIYRMGINDSPLILVTALGGFTGNFLITYAFFKSVDGSYAEAAQIDGAGHLYIFFRIMLPLATGPIFALSILTFIMQWNNYETPILFLSAMPNLASGLFIFRDSVGTRGNTPVYFAGVLMSIIPVVALVAAFGNKIMKNMSIGGLKG